jgi:hypothetical protein
MSSRRFWLSAVLAALGVSGLALLVPMGLHVRELGEFRRIWLLTVWTAGVMALLFGLAARLGGFRGFGLREISEAGSFAEAVERRRQARQGSHAPAADVWVIVTGGLLVAVYFAGWLALR